MNRFLILLKNLYSRPAFTLLVYVAVMGLFFSPLADSDGLVEGSDIIISFYAYREFLWRSLAQGVLPLWNPYIFSGTPFFPSGAVFYLPNWPLWLLPANLGVHLELYIHYVLAGLGAHFLAYRLGLSRISSFACGFAFALSGVSIMRICAGHLPQLDVRPWFPIMLGAFFALRDEGRARWLVLGALTIAMQVFACHLQIAFYYLLTLGIIALFAGPRSDALRRIVLCTKMTALGLSLSLVQLVPMVMWWAGAARVSDYHFATMMSLPPISLLGMLVPHIHGDGKLSPFIGPLFPWGVETYFGIIALLLAVFALLAFRHRSVDEEYKSDHADVPVRLLGVLILISIIMSLGKYTPIYYLIYNTIPMFDSFRSPSRALVIAELAIAVLAGTGLYRLETSGRQFRFYGAIGALLMGTIAYIGFGLVRFGSVPDGIFHGLDLRLNAIGPLPVQAVRAHLGTTLAQVGAFCYGLGLAVFILRKMQRPALSVAFICLTIIVEAAVFSGRYISTIPLSKLGWERSIVDEFHRNEAQPFRVIDSRAPTQFNLGALYGVSSANGFDGSIGKRYNRFINAIVGFAPERYTPSMGIRKESPLLDLLNVRFVITFNTKEPLPEGFREIVNLPDVRMVERPKPLGTARLVYTATYIKNEEEALEHFRKGHVDPTRIALLHDPTSPQIRKTVKEEDEGSVSIVDYGVNHLRIKARTNAPAYLVISEVYDDGWSATVDGEKATQSRVDYLLRGIYLEPGDHEVVCRYRPAGFVAGFSGSLIAFVICMIMLYREWRQRGRN